MISTIIFDLSEVLLGGMYGSEAKIGQVIGQPVPPDYLFVQAETKDFHHGKISEDEFWQQILGKNNWEIPIPTLKEIVRSQMIEIEGTRAIITALRKQGYKLGLLSVQTKEWVAYLEEKYRHHSLFHARLYSYEVGISKPDPQAFRLILEKLGAKPEETLFIDDYHVNIEAAQKLGFHTILFENAPQLTRDLKKHKIKL